MPRRALGKLTVGERLIVIPAPNRYHPKMSVEVVVTKVGRVWVDLREASNTVSQAKTWRMRLDTQDQGHGGHHQDRFATWEQLDWEQRAEAARKALFDAGITVDWQSLWNQDEDRFLALAAFVAAYDAEHPTDS